MNEQDSPAPMGQFIQKVDAAVKQAPRQSKAELARLMVLLFTAMRNCHTAYLRRNAAREDLKDDFSGDHAGPDAEGLEVWDDPDEAWSKAVSALQSVVLTLSSTLHILAPDIFQEVVQYAYSEASEAFGGDDTLGFLLEISYYNPPPEADIREVLNRLGQFIRERFSMEEIFQASTSPAL